MTSTDTPDHANEPAADTEALNRVITELDRLSRLPTVANDSGRANSFDTGARWTIRMVREAIGSEALAREPSAPADRAAILREAIDVAREEGHRLEAGRGIEAALGARSVAYLLRKLLVKAQPAPAEFELRGTAEIRSAALVEAADFLRDAHFRDGLSVQEIGTALRRMADKAQQPETQAEDPARIDRLRPEFTEHSSVESIDAHLRRARSQQRRWHLRAEWLISLRQARVEQKARGEWPAAVSQPGKEA